MSPNTTPRASNASGAERVADFDMPFFPTPPFQCPALSSDCKPRKWVPSKGFWAKLDPMPALELTHAGKRYGARDALGGVSIRLGDGETLGLLGPNGAGKTTALRLLLGFCRPTSGSVQLRGLSPTRREARRSLGYLPERLVLPDRMNVARLVEYHATLMGIEGAERARVTAETLERVGLSERAHDRIADLSKGLRQRLGFAQALVGSPSLLLLDEPTSGLDPIGIRDARTWIEEAQAAGSAVLICSHVLSEVERLCNRVAILHEGRLRADGALDELVREGETLEDAFVRVVRG